MKAIGTKVIIEDIKEEVTTKSGFLLTDTDANEIRYKRGKVISAGSDVKNIYRGDMIQYDSAAGFTIMTSKGLLKVINERDVALVDYETLWSKIMKFFKV